MSSVNFIDSATSKMDTSEEEEIFACKNSSDEDARFDAIVGCIEEIIMDDHFLKLQEEFMNKHYQHFEDSEENKLIYMEIFQEYNNLIEKHIEEQLLSRVPSFSMEEFTKQLIERKSELDGEVFEMLITFSDFLAFKEMFLDYKNAKEGRTVSFESGIFISAVPSEKTLESQIAT